MAVAELSVHAAAVRRYDPDRFLTCLFAPPAHRETLFLLYAFNHELARAREVASEPMLALIRLQWWREVVSGEMRRHELATPLRAALDAGLLDRDDLLAMIAAREMEAEPSIATRAQWRSHVEGSAGRLAVAAGRALGASGPTLDRLLALGSAYGVAGLLRGVGLRARQGRCLLPEDVLGGHGLTAHEVMAEPERARPAMADLAAEGVAWWEAGRGWSSRAVLAAGLVGVFARRDLGRVGRPGWERRGLGDRLAVTFAALAGRI
jgi:phytoene synthase